MKFSGKLPFSKKLLVYFLWLVFCLFSFASFVKCDESVFSVVVLNFMNLDVVVITNLKTPGSWSS